MTTCCNLVGNFDIKAKGIISVTSQGSTEVNLFSANGNNAITVSPSSGSVSITAYAGLEKYKGCPGRAGVSIPWIVRNNCDKLVYLFGGAGKSYISGAVGAYASFPGINGISNPVASYNVISASASSGPAALYEDSIQYDGYGLIYSGLPWTINTSTEAGCMVNLTSYGIGSYGDCRLQNINIQCVPGQIPVVNMSFIYTI
ncbi:hypothetical protein JZU46_06940 [bacterium]|nr:hypothetical protein [bacterium]